MVHPAWGPFLFDTSAESWLVRNEQAEIEDWLHTYQERHPIHVSAITMLERLKGYSLLWNQAPSEKRARIEIGRAAYLNALGRVWPFDSAAALVAGEILGAVPEPPSPPKRSHRMAESTQDRLARWRFDVMIAATALVAQMPLIHNNAVDFEPIRGAIEGAPGRFPGLGSLALISCGSLLTGTR